MTTTSVMVTDSGGTANGGGDASAPRTFTITVNSPPGGEPRVADEWSDI